MPPNLLTFATGNANKFKTGEQVCAQHGIMLLQAILDLPEIQEEDSRKVAIDKAVKAFSILGKPVIITDDSWSMAGLRGFPGVYMHSINAWFTPEDFLRLTLPLKDRGITLTRYLVYIDRLQQKVFKSQTHGTLLKEKRGTSEHPSHTIMSLDGEGGKSIAEVHQTLSDKSSRPSSKIWHEFATWYVENQTKA